MDMQKGDRVITPQGEACTVLGISMAGLATIVADDGTVLAIAADELKITERTYLN